MICLPLRAARSPLALFGATGYGRVLGRIAKPFQVMQAVAPLALAFVVERSGDETALAVTEASASRP